MAGSSKHGPATIALSLPRPCWSPEARPTGGARSPGSASASTPSSPSRRARERTSPRPAWPLVFLPGSSDGEPLSGLPQPGWSWSSASSWPALATLLVEWTTSRTRLGIACARARRVRDMVVPRSALAAGLRCRVGVAAIWLGCGRCGDHQLRRCHHRRRSEQDAGPARRPGAR